jgi:hypothetical protein
MARPKVCSRCPERGPQPLENFYARASTRDGLQAWCKACSRAERKRWAAENPSRIRALAKDTRERRNADPERSAQERDRKRQWLREKRGVTPDRYRVGGEHVSALVDAEPVYAAALASGLSLREIARRVGRDREWLARSLRGERVQAATARAVLESVGLIPADVGL